MGIYYSSISKRTRFIEGIGEVAFSNFHGKRPGWFTDNQGPWNRFCTRAENTAQWMKHHRPDVKFVMHCNPAEFTKFTEVSIAQWDGQVLLHDGFWDKHTVAKVCRMGHGVYELEFFKEKVLTPL